MWESLFDLILTRLDHDEMWFLSGWEAAAFPRGDIDALIGMGLLKEEGPAGGVCAADGLSSGVSLPDPPVPGRLGVAERATDAFPCSSAEDGDWRYEILVSGLIKRIRSANDLRRSPERSDRRLVFLGERLLPDARRADVYLALRNHDPSEFVSVCGRLRPSNPRPVVVLVPTPVLLSGQQAERLRAWDVSVAPLSACLDGRRWALPWERIPQPVVGREPPEPGREDAYCRVITRSGTRLLSRAGYQALAGGGYDYDLFIDGMTRRACCRDEQGTLFRVTLTPKELGILADYIEAAWPLRPHATRTGSHCLSQASACRLFQAARRKVDVKLGRYEYRAFRLHKNPVDRWLKAYEFAPPEHYSYCLILPP